MLGEALIDTQGIDGNAPGLGLLPLVTQFAEHKTVLHTRLTFAQLHGAWQALSGVTVQGYEIHHGQTQAVRGTLSPLESAIEVAPGVAWQSANGRILGLYLHGLLEDAAALKALFGAQAPTLSCVFDGLADFVDRHLDTKVL